MPQNNMLQNYQTVNGLPIVRVPVATSRGASTPHEARVVFNRDVPGFQPTWPQGMNPGDKPAQRLSGNLG